ncbi:MAG: Z-ring associated ZapG family protein [Gammaproteobacteria bacterium]|nr:DUF1043 family protein [Gammaproteobacteria bacterium]
MLGTHGAWGWGVGIVAFAFGLGAGFALAYFALFRDRRVKALQQELEATQAAFDAYRRRVDKSFRKTSELFQGMTRQYRDVYDHLANSAEALCGTGAVAPLLDLPDALGARPVRVPTVTGAAGTQRPISRGGPAVPPLSQRGPEGEDQAGDVPSTVDLAHAPLPRHETRGSP